MDSEATDECMIFLAFASNIAQNTFYMFANRGCAIIRKYTQSSRDGNRYAAREKPLYSEFQQLASESEYAARTLVNGYALNHVTISTHRLKTHLKDIKKLNQFIEDSGFRLNSEGGVPKEKSTHRLKTHLKDIKKLNQFIEDSGFRLNYEGGVLKAIDNFYVKEFHRRDGFEVASADKIFESTSKEQLSRVA
ncbi:hypothetical protein Fmac_001489 [Flemingia macrophylla]|uniref:2-oxoadipate dioxygenase/decarboxylase n=1 Tax=Flemingia macrophylla TaxID=520843 RepID=A0ABD1NH94_9FABA